MADEKLKENPLVLFALKMLPVIVPVVVLVGLYCAVQITNRDGMLYKFVNSPDRVATKHYKADLKEYENQVKQQNFRKKYYPEWLNVLQNESTEIEPIHPEKDSNSQMLNILHLIDEASTLIKPIIKVKEKESHSQQLVVQKVKLIKPMKPITIKSEEKESYILLYLSIPVIVFLIYHLIKHFKFIFKRREKVIKLDFSEVLKHWIK